MNTLLANKNSVPGQNGAVRGFGSSVTPGRHGMGGRLFKLLPGIALTAALAVMAIELAKVGWLRTNGFSALTLAIVLGMMAGNTVYPRLARIAHEGVTSAKQRLLRLGIIFYGLRLTFQDIAGVGIGGVVIDAVMLSTTFALSWWAGTRLFKLDRNTCLLIGAGSSICGAAAVMAAEPVVRGRAEQATVAVSTVVVFGTLAMFLYPALFHLAAQHARIAMSPAAYGIFAGSTIHEVAQVVVAGRSVGDAAANTAVITKMVRVMMLAPFLVLLSAYLSRSSVAAHGSVAADAADGGRERDGETLSSQARRAGNIVIPWFALGFAAVAGLNSLLPLPRPAVDAALGMDTFLLAMAMSGLGLTTHWAALRAAGIKPLALALVLFIWLVLGGAAINAGVTAVLR